MASEITDEDTKVMTYFPGGVRVHGRVSVRDDIDPRIHVQLHGQPEPAEMTITVGQALDLIESLSKATRQFCERRDIRDALLRTDPLTEV